MIGNILESGHLKDQEVNHRVILKLVFAIGLQVVRADNGRRGSEPRFTTQLGTDDVTLPAGML